MALEDKLENIYLNIWRGIILFTATIALLVAVFASFAALSGLFGSEPYRPLELKVEDRSEALKQALSIDSLKNAVTREPGQQLASDKDSAQDRDLNGFVSETLRKISENLDKYAQTAFPGHASNREAIRSSVKNTMKDAKLPNGTTVRLYLSSLEALSQEVMKIGGEQSLLPEDKRIGVAQLLHWHTDTVQRTLQAVTQENEKRQKNYQQQLVDYANRHTRIMSYIGVAAGAFAMFVFTVFLFVIVRIERDLRMMAVASVMTSKQLET